MFYTATQEVIYITCTFQSNAFLDPGSLFQGEPEETLPKVLKVIEVLNFYK